MVQSSQTNGWKRGIILTAALLLFTQLANLNAAEMPVDRLDFSQNPTFGERALSAGFLPDPFTVEVTSGGVVNASYLPGSCTGWASEAPDYRLNWSGDSDELRILFEAYDGDDDATLIINLPDGTWSCNDDATFETLNPMVIITNPMVGQYDIWVGSYSEGDYIAGTLSITELDIVVD